MKTCKYEAFHEGEVCKNQVNASNGEEYCIFHAPKDKKGISVEEFNKLILEKIKHEDFSFEGYIFPGDIDFRKVEFLVDANFDAAQFSGKAIFAHAKFSRGARFYRAQFSGDASFTDAQFSENASFRDAQFSWDANFCKTQFSGKAHFYKTQFSGDASFTQAQFSGDASFTHAQFSGIAEFREAQFSGDASFTHAHFSCTARFTDAQFSGIADFGEAQFSWDAIFCKTQFSGKAHFYKTQFSDDISFTDAQFSGIADFGEVQFSGKANFRAAQFSGDAHFAKITLSGELAFTDTKFDENCRFTFSAPRFDLQEDKQCLLIFERIQFNPYLTYFENIDPTNALSKPDDTSIGFLFRYCQLKDVYFSNCHMSNFSFYKSSFDEARFISSGWGEKKEKVVFVIPYIRKNIIFEEVLLDEVKHHTQRKGEDLKETFKIEDLGSYSDTEILYQRMKAALDRTKSFHEAGWFYFNEFEMKRQALREKIKIGGVLKRIKDRIYLFLKYNLYLIFAGYGEKPNWSIWWLIIFTFLFAPLHLLSGLQVGEATTINYTFSPNLEGLKSVFSWQYGGDFFTALVYSLYRIIPVSYLPKTPTSMTPIGLDGLFLSLINTLVMILMLSFIIIGLKRRFRRF